MPHVLVFAKSPHHLTPYDEWLAGSDIEPIVLTPAELAPGYANLRHVHAFEGYDHGQMVEKRALELARSHGVVAVFARGESDIVRAAQLRDLLGLRGQGAESALAYRDKVVMKERLQGSGVALPTYRALDSAYAAIDFVADHGFPVVIKPRMESGSSGVRIIRDQAQLDEHLADPLDRPAEIETYVEGTMYHVDGLVLDGEIAFIHPFRYVNDCLSYRDDQFSGSVTLSPSHPDHGRLVASAVVVVGALPSPPSMAFHAEFWISEGGDITFCEIASRTGGGMISSTIKHSFGFDIDREWLLAECGLPPSVGHHRFRPGGAVRIPPLDGFLEHLPRGGEPRCVREVQFSGRAGERFHGGVKSGLFLAGYVVEGDSEAEVVQNIDQVAAWFAANARWRMAAAGSSAPSPEPVR